MRPPHKRVRSPTPTHSPCYVCWRERAELLPTVQCNVSACLYDNWACVTRTALPLGEPVDGTPPVQEYGEPRCAPPRQVGASLNMRPTTHTTPPEYRLRESVITADVPAGQASALDADGTCVWVPPLHACLPTNRMIPLGPTVHPKSATADDLAEGVGMQLAAALAGFQLTQARNTEGAGSTPHVADQYHIDGAASILWRAHHREAALRNDTGAKRCREHPVSAL